jgi:hypothetical protein
MLPLFALVLLATPLPVQEEAPRAAATLTLDDVLKLVHAGVSEEIIVARVKRFNKPFDLNSDEILELKKAGVSDAIIKCLLDPALPYAPPPPPPATEVKPPGAPPPPPKDPLTLKVPPEPGIYRLAKAAPGEETFERLEIKPVIPLKRGSGKMGSMLSGGLLKDHTLGFIAGPKSKTRAAAGTSVFYARFDGKASPDDLVLLRLVSADAGREFDFGPKPDKPAFPPEAICQMDTSEAGPNVYRLTAPALKPGEYLFFILGSGDEKRGLLGKGHEFGVP